MNYYEGDVQVKKAIYCFGCCIIILLLFMFIFGGEIHFKINDPVKQLGIYKEMIQNFFYALGRK
jgi:hypothetical protein